MATLEYWPLVQYPETRLRSRGKKAKNGVKWEKYRRAKRAERYPGGGGETTTTTTLLALLINLNLQNRQE